MSKPVNKDDQKAARVALQIQALAPAIHRFQNRQAARAAGHRNVVDAEAGFKKDQAKANEKVKKVEQAIMERVDEIMTWHFSKRLPKWAMKICSTGKMWPARLLGYRWKFWDGVIEKGVDAGKPFTGIQITRFWLWTVVNEQNIWEVE